MIVDDEPLARGELKRIIEADKDFQVAAEAANGEEALQKLEKGNIQTIFLDIEMPGLSGLEVASRLTELEKPPLVVFATAYHEYAIKAFEASAVDYILKPYDPKRIEKTLKRIRQFQEDEEDSAREKLVSLEDTLIRQGKLRKIVGHKRNSKDRIVIDPSQVSYFQADLAEVTAHLDNEDLIVNCTLKELLQNLEGANFAQSHKSFVVNLDKVEKVSRLFSGNFELALKDSAKSKIPLSRRYSKNLKKVLGAW